MESKIISQSNVLTSSRIEYTALERNIFYMVLRQLSKEDKKYYYVSINEIKEKTGVENGYFNYMEATEKLLSRVYRFKRPENGNILQVSLFSSCEYLKGQGVIEISIDEKLKPYLFDLKSNFTELELEVALGLNSKYSKRLYEILKQWKDQEEKTFDLLELKRMLDLYNPETGKEQYKNWTDFEKRVLITAQKELKKIKGDLTFSYKANKFGRKYSSITFKIKHMPFQKSIDFKDQTSEMFSQLVNRYMLRRDQAQRALDMYEINELKKLLYPIQLRIINKEIKNIGAFTAKALNL